MPDPRTIYRLLVKLYPARFREEYGTPLESQFWDDYREAHGFRAKTWFWLHALADLGLSIPAEIFRELRQDLRYAARIHRQRSTTTALALIALALAIGSTTGVFSVVNALLLRSLPFREPSQLVDMWLIPIGAMSDLPAQRAWIDGSHYLTDAAGYEVTEVNLGQTNLGQTNLGQTNLGQTRLEQTQGVSRVKLVETTASFFSVLGAEPEIGRAFAPGEDVAGKDRVAVLSHALWQQAFGGDSRVLGSTIELNGAPMKVIGVAPPRLDFPAHAALWTPTAYDWDLPSKHGVIQPRHVGRLKPGVTLTQAQAMFDTEVGRKAPAALKEAGGNRPRLSSLRDQVAGPVRTASLVLLGAVGFVLLIACANVAHLLLSRITERRQELVIRAALGASRARLVQQLVTECTLLTLAATGAGMVVAHWAARLAAGVQPTGLASQSYTILDGRVLAFAIALAAATGLLFGVLPASLIGRLHPAADLVRSRPGHQPPANRLRSLLVAIQAAATIMLLAGAFTLGRSFLKLTGAELGFRTDHVVTFNVALSGTPHENAIVPYYEQALDRLRAIPGVEAAGATEYLPLTRDLLFMAGHFRPDNSREEQIATLLNVTPGYFPAMRTQILEGRDFLASDRDAAIVNQSFARRFAALGPLAGRRLNSSFHKKALTIVGVVRDQEFAPGASLRGSVFVPSAQWHPTNLTFVARVRGRTEAYLPVGRDALRSVDPKAPVFNASTLTDRLDDSLATPRFYTTAILFFGAFSLLLAVTGVYGVSSFVVTQRMHEIGVRLAVGASPKRLRVALLRQSLMPVLAGVAAGAAGALGVGQVAAHLIQSAEPVGAAACVVAAAALAATAAIAIWKATHRILRLDPMQVLRAE